MTIAEEEALRELLLDIDCLNCLDKWADNFNIFDVLKITNMEIRHSNILAWLLDPNENHGLRDGFLRKLLTRIVSNKKQTKYNAFDILLQNLYSYQVYRESNHMDIVLYSHEEQTAVIIENKIWSGESSHQLNDYMNKCKVTYEDCRQILYVFLTPDGHNSSDPVNWIPLSYEEVLKALCNAKNDISLRPEVNFVIENYVDTIRRKIMKEKDEELVRICNEIYNKHQTAFRLIFDNVSVDNSLESEIICSTLKELSTDGSIIYGAENKWQFSTKRMNDYLPVLPEANSSWGTNCEYYYWFERYDEHLIIHFELGGRNLTSELRKRQEKLIAAAGKKVDDYIYKRLYYKKVKISQDDYENSLKKAVVSLVKSALENEENLLAKVLI